MWGGSVQNQRQETQTHVRPLVRHEEEPGPAHEGPHRLQVFHDLRQRLQAAALPDLEGRSPPNLQLPQWREIGGER